MGEVFDRYTDTAGNEHWCDTETGKHTIPASEYSYVQKLQSDRTLKGWICPVCERGLSPYTSVCQCKGFDPGWKVTC